MIVGVCRIALILPGNDSLKGKRAVVRRIVDRTRSRFNVAAAEIEDMDVKRRAVIGFVVVSNDSRHANSMLDNIASFVLDISDAVIVDQQMKIVRIGDEMRNGSASWSVNQKKFYE
ncbi:MAG: DUF503 domain-containing protein [Deltaproteobacteria bacterium]|nr:DUF503 domain-containing protein [Deltaproteobacteria bacterium]